MNLAVLNLATGISGQIDVFRGADNLNPSFDHEGNLIFLSDRDGYRNMYKYVINTGEILQLTDFPTGISGITKFSPAISVATSRDRVVYTYFNEGKYVLYQGDSADMLNTPVEKTDIDNTALTLPVAGSDKQQVIQKNLDNLDKLPEVATETFSNEKYRPKFRLDYAGGSTGIGVSSGSYGARTGLAGGIELLFSDVLGNNQIYSVVALNGDILDFGASVQYLNTKGRLAWGVSISHVPYRTGFVQYFNDSIPAVGGNVAAIREDINLIRIFEDQASLLLQLPFSKTRRLEGSVGANYQYFRHDRYPNLYTLDGRWQGQRSREKVENTADTLDLGGYTVKRGLYYSANLAYVGDNSSFGLTAPLNGYRYRLEAAKNFGTYDFWAVTADGRAYQFLKPISLAFRITHHARYGEDADNFNPILIGYQGLVHGYDYNQIIKRLSVSQGSSNWQTLKGRLTEELYRLSGSKIIVTGMEVRLPFSGPERLSVIKSSLLYSDLSWFFDAGVAFDEFKHFREGEDIDVEFVDANGNIVYDTVTRKPKVAMSTGFSLRINLFGALIIEPYIAYPLEKGAKPLFGLYFVPGW
jgi:hypothetical protein